MMEPDPAHMFRGLPLTAEQDSEIRHYIHGRLRNHLPWDTPELRAMLADMLHPPEIDEEELHTLFDSIDKERTAVVQEGGRDRDKADPSPES